METCPCYDQHETGLLYATMKAPSLTTRDPLVLTPEERALRDRFIAFERHYFECDVCFERLREDQELRNAFDALARNEIAVHSLRSARERRSSAAARRFLPLAASLLLVSTVCLSAWVVTLTHRIGDAGVSRHPVTVASLFLLQPERPAERSSAPVLPRVPAVGRSCLIAVDGPAGDTAASRFELRLLDERGRALWEDGDARPGPDGRLTVSLAPGLLKPGRYALKASMIDRVNGSEMAAAAFPFIAERGSGGE